MTEVVSIREKLRHLAEARGFRLTYLPFIVKAVSMALREYPLLNSTFDEEKNEIVVKKQINVGIAVDTEQGLVVVVIRDADRKSIMERAQEASALAEKARGGKLSLGEVTGSTFSISNIGAIGGVGGLAIINHPEGAIMALGRITKRPIVDDEDRIRIRHTMMVTVSFDHRIVDGAYVARFMNRVKELLENPYIMLTELR
jgi:pyruvate dehydrogenase E2 component (dihydrolipoamide acetyltransferase)